MTHCSSQWTNKLNSVFVSVFIPEKQRERNTQKKKSSPLRLAIELPRTTPIQNSTMMKTNSNYRPKNNKNKSQ